MSIEENTQMMRRYVLEAIQTNNTEMIDEIIAEDYISHQAAGDEIRGIEEYKRFLDEGSKAFPDIHYTIETMIAERDFVCARIKGRATHKAELMGIAPTGKTYTFEEAIFSRFENGKIAEEWEYVTSPTLMEQIKANTTN